MKLIWISAGVLIAAASMASAETKSGLTESVTIGVFRAGGERARGQVIR